MFEKSNDIPYGEEYENELERKKRALEEAVEMDRVHPIDFPIILIARRFFGNWCIAKSRGPRLTSDCAYGIIRSKIGAKDPK